MAELDVDPELFYEAAGAYSLASRTAVAALDALDKALRTATQMSGDDDGGAEWGKKYGWVGAEATVSASVGTQVLYRMAALIRQSGVNHDQSEMAEEYNKPNGALPDADPGGQTLFARPLKNPGGGSRPVPFGWVLVMGAEKWINGDTTKLQAAADEWTKLASAYGALDNGIKPKMTQLLNFAKTEETPDIDETNKSVLDALELLSDSMRNVGSATSGYADVLAAAQDGIERHLTLLAGAGVLDVLGAVVSGGTLTKAARELAEAEADVTRNRIQEILKGLTTSRNLTISVLDGAHGTLTTAVGTKFNPVLQKQLQRPPEPTKSEQARENKARGARAEARAGIDPTKTKKSIKSETGTASRRIPDDLDDANKRIVEVKNVDYQAYTDQIKDFQKYAEKNGYTFELVVDQRTKLDPELQKQVDQGKIKLKPLDLNS
ncbi:putative toxin [Nocardia sp. NPDC050710]|uniref:putative toxin n=1 Tax=Nocardia sp. NPDC050710 TaxID=3157220 RepID=UPI0033C1E750